MIALERVSKSFADGTVAIAAVSLTLARGELVALCGESGSGKTTLLKTINRLIEPDAGSITIDGRSVLERPAHALRREIGYVFQGTGLFPHMSVAENIAITPRLLRWPEEQIAQRVSATLESVGLSRELLGRRPAELSGGQQQRVAVARAVGGQPSILLADEPTGNLDSKNGEAVMELLRELHRGGATICMVTHDPRYARYADRSIHLFDGRIVEENVEAA